MSGKLLEAARNDIQRILNSGGFEDDISISNPDGSITAQVKGLHSKHWISFDTDGSLVNSKNAHISITESDLVSSGFQTRNIKTGNVDLKGFRVTAKDSTGVEKKFTISENFPSETTGLIVCILGDRR